MLTRAEIADAKRETADIRICTICDGMEAVIRLASWLSHFPQSVGRVDLDWSEAMDQLEKDLADKFDLMVISLSSERGGTSPRQLQAILDATEARCTYQVVLLPPDGRLKLREGTRVRSFSGPPFAHVTGLSDLATPNHAADVSASSEGGSASGILARLLRRKPVPKPAMAANTNPLRVLACLPATGGAGASTLACNLGRAFAAGQTPLEVCIIDLDLQYGTQAGYFDIQPEERVLDAYRKLSALDSEGFELCLREVTKGLSVFTAPEEILPLDALDRKGLARLVDFATQRADLVILDLPPAVAEWTGTAMALADRVMVVSQLDVRSARAIARFRALAGAEELPMAKLLPVVTHAPKRRPPDWEDRLASFEKGLGMPVAAIFGEGGEALTAACDAGVPPEKLEPNSPFQTALSEFAEQLRQSAIPGIAARRRE